MKPKDYYRVHKRSPLNHMLSEYNPVRPFAMYISKLYLNILPHPPRSHILPCYALRLISPTTSSSGLTLSRQRPPRRADDTASSALLAGLTETAQLYTHSLAHWTCLLYTAATKGWMAAVCYDQQETKEYLDVPPELWSGYRPGTGVARRSTKSRERQATCRDRGQRKT